MSISAEGRSAINAAAMRDVLGQYPTGVAVVTAIAGDGEALAMVVGTFSSVSLDPPLVSFMPMKTSFVFDRMRNASGFVVNVLAHDQEVLCRELARPVPHKLEHIDWKPSAEIGAPILPDVLAHIECSSHSVLEGGDHFIVLGEVLNLQTHRAESPLIFLQGGFGGFAPPAFMHVTDQELARAVATAQHAQHDIEQIAEELDAVVEVFARIGQDAALVASSNAKADQFGEFLGARYPVIPPFGEHFIASQEGDEGNWFSRVYGMAEADMEHFRARLSLIRNQKWSFTVADFDCSSELFDAVRDYADRPLPISHRRLARSAAEARPAFPIEVPGDSEKHRIAMVLAPVNDFDGKARFVVRVRFGGREMSGAELREIGERLVAHCDRLASQLALAEAE